MTTTRSHQVASVIAFPYVTHNPRGQRKTSSTLLYGSLYYSVTVRLVASTSLQPRSKSWVVVDPFRLIVELMSASAPGRYVVLRMFEVGKGGREGSRGKDVTNSIQLRVCNYWLTLWWAGRQAGRLAKKACMFCFSQVCVHICTSLVVFLGSIFAVAWW